jgi:hypothetical protein
VVDKVKFKIFLSQAHRLKARDDYPLNGTHCHVVQDCIPHFGGKVLSLTQENAVDLHSVVSPLKTNATTVGEIIFL